MSEAEHVSIAYEPIIDAQNPPIAADSVLLAEALTGSIRVSCFSGNPYVQHQDEIVAQDESKITRMWIRPVAVIDVSYAAVRYIEGYLLQRLSVNPEGLKRVLSDNPQLKASLKAVLEELGTERE